MEIRVTGDALDPLAELAAFEARHPELKGQVGGLATFIGSMRGSSQGSDVAAMELQHYPGMTEKYLERVCREAGGKWSLIETLVIHRHGALLPGDPIVLVAVWSAHRAEAFAACRYIIDELKTRAPFWKNETTPEGRRWVTGTS